MTALVLIPMLLGLGAPVSPVPAPVAQVAATLPMRTDAALARVGELEGRDRALAKRQAALSSRYQGHRGQVETLRRSRPSWNRDRKLRAARALANESAQAAKAVDAEKRLLADTLASAKQAALAAVEAELSTGSLAPDREKRLRRMRAAFRQAAAAKARPIRLPDLSIDQLADPEELLEQAALIGRAEKRLAGEVQELETRERKYLRIASLRGQRRRDAELGAFTGDDIRRTTGRVRGQGDANREAAAEGGASAEPFDAGSPSGDAPPGTPGGTPPDDTTPQTGETGPTTGSFQALAVILADVIDDSAEQALRRASRTADAETRADAATRAKAQVKTELERLRERRRAILDRVKKLRK